MKNILSSLLVLILMFAVADDASAQKKRKDKKEKTGQQVEISLKNGNKLVGELLKYSKDSIVISNAQFGRMAFASDEVDDYSKFSTNGNNWDKSKYQGQYFLSPTARPIGKGNKYYSNFDIFANTFAFGVSDNFSISAGFEAISVFAGNFPIVYVTPKWSIPLNENAYIGVGTTAFAVTFDSEFALGGIAFANTTIGSAIQNFTAGLGYIYSTEGSLEDPLLQLGFTFPISKKVSILAESYTTTGFEGVFNIGLRIITKSNLVFDVGITRPTADIDGLGIPLLSFSIPL